METLKASETNNKAPSVVEKFNTDQQKIIEQLFAELKHIENKNWSKILQLFDQVENINSYDNLVRTLLNCAIDSKNHLIVKAITWKINSSYFDHDLLKNAITSGNPRSVELIAQRSNTKIFDQDLIIHAAHSENPRIIETVADRTNRNLFNSELWEKLGTSNTKHILLKYFDIPESRIILYNDMYEKQLNNVADQILNLKDNNGDHIIKQKLLLDVFSDVITSEYNSGRLHPNFPLAEFLESLNKSAQLFNEHVKISLNTLNEKNRFLIIPLYSSFHTFSAIVEKLADDKYSIILVNKGDRPKIQGKYVSPFIEYVLSHKDATELLNKHALAQTLNNHYPFIEFFFPLDASKVYKEFSAKSINEYSLNIESKDQKVGNCFIINLLKAAQFQVSKKQTLALNNDFNPSSLRQPDAQPYKIKFGQPLLRKNQHVDEFCTLDGKEKLIKALSGKISKKLSFDGSFKKYKSEKLLRLYLYAARKGKKSLLEKILKAGNDSLVVKPLNAGADFNFTDSKNMSARSYIESNSKQLPEARKLLTTMIMSKGNQKSDVNLDKTF